MPNPHSWQRAALLAIVAFGSTAAIQAAQVLTVCTSGAPEGFDIVQHELTITNDQAGLPLFDTLVRFKPGSTELSPGLAERWDISPDGLAYTLQLRRGVQFHSTAWFKPTREMNADDVLFSINRMFDKSHWAHTSARKGYIYWSGMEMDRLIKAVDKLDEYKVRFTLARPNTPFLANLAISSIGAIYPLEYASALHQAAKLDQLDTLPVGSGPFVFRSYLKDAVLRYDAHPRYWGGRPALDRLIFAITVDPEVREQRVKAGECLVGPDLKGQSVSAFNPNGPIRVLRSSQLSTDYVGLNTQRGFLADARFRRALWLAIDKKALIKAAIGGQAQPATSFLPPGMGAHDKSLMDRADPKQAMALIKASGYDGRVLQLFTGPASNAKQAIEMLQADWARVGVKVAVQTLEVGALFARTASGEHDIMVMSFSSDNGDPDNFFGSNLSCAAIAAGSNRSRWCSPRFDELLDAANRSTDAARRKSLYTEAQRLVWDEVPVIPLTYPLGITAVHKRVQGFVPSPFSNLDFRNVSLLP